ncbi:unnamed protein product, partial [marine sediment metagenome]
DDFAVSVKQDRQEQGRRIYRELHPDWKDIINQWSSIAGRTDLLLKHGQVEKVENKPRSKKYKKTFKEALRDYMLRWDGNKYVCYISEKELLQNLSDAGYVAYYRDISIPKLIEFRRNDERVLIQVRARR